MLKTEEKWVGPKKGQNVTRGKNCTCSRGGPQNAKMSYGVKPHLFKITSLFDLFRIHFGLLEIVALLDEPPKMHSFWHSTKDHVRKRARPVLATLDLIPPPRKNGRFWHRFVNFFFLIFFFFFFARRCLVQLWALNPKTPKPLKS